MNEEARNDSTPDTREQEKRIRKLERKLERAEERLVDYERLVDRTQHLLNTRIEEVEAARNALARRTAELEESEQRFRQLADAAFEAIIIHDGDRILDCNSAAEHLYKRPKSQLVGSRIGQLIHSGQSTQETGWLHQATEQPLEMIHLRADGGKVPVEVRSRVIQHKGEKAFITAVRDITTFKAMEAELRKIANSDPLTGVGNRRFFLDMGKKEYFRAMRYATPLALIMLDIDYFKKINDTYGHEIGDLAIKSLASVCRNTLRDCDVLARIGGEEFAIILPESDMPGGAALAERLRQNVEKNVVDTEMGPIRFTISLGVTDLREGDEDIESLLKRADIGLYRSKEAGRNRVSCE